MTTGTQGYAVFDAVTCVRSELRWMIASLTNLEFEAYSMKHCVYTQLWAIKSGLFNDADANILRLKQGYFYPERKRRGYHVERE